MRDGPSFALWVGELNITARLSRPCGASLEAQSPQRKRGGGEIAQESREAGDLMSEHQGIFGEQRATKISELVFVPIDSPNILLSDCRIQSVKSC